MRPSQIYSMGTLRNSGGLDGRYATLTQLHSSTLTVHGCSWPIDWVKVYALFSIFRGFCSSTWSGLTHES